MIVAHHADLLRLLQNIVNPLGGTVQDDVGLRGVLDLFQEGPGTRKHNFNWIFNAIYNCWGIASLLCLLGDLKSYGRGQGLLRFTLGLIAFL